MAHLKMMGAAQPFISGAISKTREHAQRLHRRGMSADTYVELKRRSCRNP